jgi:hypothetical protein
LSSEIRKLLDIQEEQVDGGALREENKTIRREIYVLQEEMLSLENQIKDIKEDSMGI